MAQGAWISREDLLWSPALGLLGLVAGMTGRAQGSMAGSMYPLDEQAANRAKLARQLGFEGVVRVKQVHGREVVRVNAPLEPWPTADALWTDEPGVLLGVAAADCVPVLVADPRGPVGAAHAGWQGTSLAVAAALVEAMVAGGAVRERLAAAIGPSIGPCCYTIDEERASLIEERLGTKSLIRDRRGITFDLWAANAAQLSAVGVQRIEIARLCTRSGGADLWSYRGRDADGSYGTQLAFIGRGAGRGRRSA
jgi:purine-nucleoside/S-methyl-5'-thioadenosine phosphorylase / adenosine deaminase